MVEDSKENNTEAPVQSKDLPKVDEGEEISAISETNDQSAVSTPQAQDEGSDDDFIVVDTEDDM